LLVLDPLDSRPLNSLLVLATLSLFLKKTIALADYFDTVSPILKWRSTTLIVDSLSLKRRASDSGLEWKSEKTSLGPIFDADMMLC
jgi:hypothetical protein